MDITTKQRVDYLDGLRGIAAVIVVFHHLFIGFYPSTYTLNPDTVHTGANIERILHNTPWGIGINGGLAVSMFLLLSGYVVGLSTKNKLLPEKVASGIIKRFFRFSLPILATNLLAWILISLGWFWNQSASNFTGSSWWLSQMWQMKPSLFEAIRQSYMSLFTMYPLNQVYNSSVWTMPFFFLGPVFLLIFVVLTQNWKRKDIFLILAIMWLAKTHYWLIILGYLLSKLPAGFLKKWSKLPMRYILMVVVLFLGNYPQSYDTAYASKLYGWLPILNFTHTSVFYQAIASVAMLLLLMSSVIWQRILSSKIFKFLGKISFSLYLFHVLVINTLTSLVFNQSIRYMSYSQAFGISVLISLPVILLGSIGLYKFFEKPSAKMSQTITTLLQ